MISNLVQKIEEYKKKSYEKHLSHVRNARNSNHWALSLEVFGVILSAGLALSTVILGTLGASNFELAITSGIFSFFISVSQRIQNSYNFLVLEVKHNILADDYYAIYYELDKIDPENINYHEYENIINKYMLVSQKHTQKVKDCFFFCFYKTQ